MMEKKNCYHCIYIRPKRGNMCSISKEKIANINTYFCENFKTDIFLQRMEESLDKKDDDGSKRPYWLFNSPFNFAFV